MKPFDLKKALAGEPVRLRNGSKAYVKYKIPDEFHTEIPLSGYFLKSFLGRIRANRQSWRLNGKVNQLLEHDEDIVSMWEGPLPRVQLDLPCPIKELSFPCYNLNGYEFKKESILEHSALIELHFKNGMLFATKEDAQEWLDAMRGARR